MYIDNRITRYFLQEIFYKKFFTNSTNGLLTIHVELLQKFDYGFYNVLHIGTQNGADYFSNECAKEKLGVH